MTKKKNLPLRYNLPQGELTVYKKVEIRDKNDDFVEYAIATLIIPASADAIKARGGYGKCRASLAYVARIQGMGVQRFPAKVFYTKDYATAVAMRDNTKYTRGRNIRPYCFDRQEYLVCAGGIHFFLTRRKAELY